MGTIAGMIIAIYFAINYRWRSFAIMFVTTIATASVSGFLKTYFMSPRPLNSLIALADPSFPSSHSSMSAAVLFAIIYLFAPKINSWIKREIMIVVCVLGIIAIGLSRIILNVHWFSDIIAGWSLGIFITTTVILLVKYISAIIIRKNV
jgi:undecaprenyl-diphosphatase